MSCRCLMALAALTLLTVAAGAEELPPGARIIISEKELRQPTGPIMPTMQIAPDVAAASVASGIVHGIKPEIVAESVEGTVRALVQVVPESLPVSHQTQYRRLNAAIRRHLLPGVTIKAPE